MTRKCWPFNRFEDEVPINLARANIFHHKINTLEKLDNIAARLDLCFAMERPRFTRTGRIFRIRYNPSCNLRVAVFLQILSL